MTPDKSTQRRYRELLERTAPVAGFSAAALRRQLEATVPGDETEIGPGKYLEKTRHTDSGTGLTATSSDEAPRFGGGEDIVPLVLTGSRDPEKRFEILGVIGRGASGKIYEVLDHSLERVIAIKRLDLERGKRKGRAAQFIREARTTAQLEHPNILPVYDIGASSDNDIHFSMRRVSGHSLGAAIRTATDAGVVPEAIAGTNDRLAIILKVCDALAFAHSKGFVHQDVKPDNIMVGEYGEVLLLDWGSAGPSVTDPESGQSHIVGTPAYMSPEQARREGVDARSDVYCLGATLFHLLLLRHPAWSEDPDEFWEKKRSGAIDPLTDDERARVPAPLLDIVLKAMEPEARQRYQTMRELADDSKRFQAGLAVSAHRDTFRERVLRWYRRNRRVFWVAAASASVVLTLAMLLFREKLKEFFFWHEVYAADFSTMNTADLARDWKCYAGPRYDTLFPVNLVDTNLWAVESGMLVGTAARSGVSNLTFSMPSAGNVRVEWDVTSRVRNQNLNCFIGGRTRNDGYTFHVGGWNNPYYVALSKGRSGDDVVDFTTIPH